MKDCIDGFGFVSGKLWCGMMWRCRTNVYVWVMRVRAKTIKIMVYKRMERTGMEYVCNGWYSGIGIDVCVVMSLNTDLPICD